MRETAVAVRHASPTPRAARQRSHAADRLHHRGQAGRSVSRDLERASPRRSTTGMSCSSRSCPRRRRQSPRCRSWRPRSGLPIGTWTSSDSPYLELAGTWDSYWASLSAKFRSNVRNRLSRLNADRRAGARSPRTTGRIAAALRRRMAARGVGLEGSGRDVDLLGPGGAAVLHAARGARAASRVAAADVPDRRRTADRHVVRRGLRRPPVPVQDRLRPRVPHLLRRSSS